MMKIAICDDDKYTTQKLKEILMKSDKQMIIEIFYSGEDLMDRLENNYTFDVIFLDIELEQMSGIEVGSKIRVKLGDYITKIIFISGQTIYDRQLFEIHPFNFISKPIDEDKVIYNINLINKMLQSENKFFSYKLGHEVVKIQTKEIIYFESIGKQIKLVSVSGEHYFYEALKNVYSQLPDTFILCHRSFIANYYKIEKLSREYIQMQCVDCKIPISKYKLKEVQKLYMSLERKIINGRNNRFID